MSKKDIIDYVTETPGNTNKKVLERLINEVEGTKLPEVTTEDNGDVLTVVEGTWDKAVPSGGGTTTIIIPINATVTEDNGNISVDVVVENAQSLVDMLADVTYNFDHLTSYNLYCDLRREGNSQKLYLAPEMMNSYFAYETPNRLAYGNPFAQGVMLTGGPADEGEELENLAEITVYLFVDNVVESYSWEFTASDITQNNTLEFSYSDNG